MRANWKTLVGTVLSIALVSSPVMAKLPNPDQFHLGDGVYIEVGSRVLEPFAEVIFCHQLPTECTPGEGDAMVELTPAVMWQLTTVNGAINRAIAPKADDPAIMGGNVWRLAPAAGDCKDYAITKRHELIGRGLPAGALRLAIVHTWSGEGHMVLVVTTSQGDLVLDNLTAEIRPWREAHLTWQMIQSANDPRQWYSIDETMSSQRAVDRPMPMLAGLASDQVKNVWDYV